MPSALDLRGGSFSPLDPPSVLAGSPNSHPSGGASFVGGVLAGQAHYKIVPSALEISRVGLRPTLPGVAGSGPDNVARRAAAGCAVCPEGTQLFASRPEAEAAKPGTRVSNLLTL